MKPPSPVPVFLSYVPRDARYARELESHLAMFARLGVVQPIPDRGRARGDERRDLRSEIDAAWVIVVLASADYLASEEIVHVERALPKHELGHAKIIPVRLRACYLGDSPLADLTWTPRGEQAIVSSRNRDPAWVKVLAAIRGAIDDLHQTRLNTPPPPPPPSDVTPLPIAMEDSSRLHPATQIVKRTPITDLVKQKLAKLQPTNLVAFDRFRDAARLSAEAERDQGGEGARVRRAAACRELLDCIEIALFVRFDRVRAAARSVPSWTDGLDSDDAGAALRKHLVGDTYPLLVELDAWLAGPRKLPSGAASALRRSLGIPRGLEGSLAKAARLRGEISASKPISAEEIAHLEWVAGSLINRRKLDPPEGHGPPRG